MKTRLSALEFRKRVNHFRNGKTNTEIARLLVISKQAVGSQLSHNGKYGVYESTISRYCVALGVSYGQFVAEDYAKDIDKS